MVGDDAPDRDKISHHRLEGGDHAGLLALIDRMRERGFPPEDTIRELRVPVFSCRNVASSETSSELA